MFVHFNQENGIILGIISTLTSFFFSDHPTFVVEWSRKPAEIGLWTQVPKWSQGFTLLPRVGKNFRSPTEPEVQPVELKKYRFVRVLITKTGSNFVEQVSVTRGIWEHVFFVIWHLPGVKLQIHVYYSYVGNIPTIRTHFSRWWWWWCQKWHMTPCWGHITLFPYITSIQ